MTHTETRKHDYPAAMPTNYLTAILNARVYDVAKETSLDFAKLLSDRFQNEISIKREDQQPIFCYKIRGSYNKMSTLSDAQLKKGVVAASAGNHAQGVAYAARELGCRATIFMPITAPGIKVDSVRRLGADVKLIGDSFDVAYEAAMELCQKQGKSFIDPFDDPAVIAGQGTVGLEILKQHVGPDAIFIPVGGGGLISGVAAYVKQVRPEVKIIGVEPEDADALYQSMEAGRRIKLKEVGIFADGVAVKQVGKENFKLCRQYVDQVVRVNTDEICAAVKDIFEDTRTIVEPAGALSVAGIKRWLKENSDNGQDIRGQKLVAIASGANTNFDRLRHVSERAEIGERRESIIAVTIPEKAGSFKKLIKVLGNRSVSEFNYRFSGHADAHIFIGIQVSQPKETSQLIEKFKSRGFAALDLTDNEIAKVHARHMVGGRLQGVENERIFSFEFPERPGALKNFLEKVKGNWNISLFHYRNHGSDFGRVLCGIQVPGSDRKIFDQFLKELNYRFTEETDNPVYKLFLS